MLEPESNFALRERNFWESSDLAILMLRNWIVPLLASFGSILGLVCIVTLFSLIELQSWLPIIIILYLKPVWERIIISQAGLLFFQPQAKLGQRLASLRRIFSTEMLKDLTWGRFSPYRAYRLPLRMFERPEKSRRRDRRRWLCQEMGGQLVGVIALHYTLEILIFCGIYFSTIALFSANLEGMSLNSSGLTTAVFVSISYFISLLIVEPLYTLNCFSLYINRRTLHEGWDLRLALRQLLAARGSQRKAVKALAIIGCLFFFAGASPSLQAQTSPAPETTIAAKNYQDQLSRAMDTRDFGGEDRTVEWGFKESKPSTEKTPKLPVIPNLVGPNILRILVFTAAGVLVVILIILLFKRLPGMRRVKAAEPPPPVIAPSPPSGHQQRALALADALAAWEQGDQRQAMACLYQAGISMATKIYLVKLPSSATEGRCVAIINHSNAPWEFSQLFGDLTKAWMQVSWSHRPLAEARFQDLYQALLNEQGKSAA